jgi:hypothetical protein
VISGHDVAPFVLSLASGNVAWLNKAAGSGAPAWQEDDRAN